MNKTNLSPFLNKLIQGDCVKKLKVLPEKSIDLIFADPPYNLQLKQALFRPNLTKVHAVDDDWDKFSGFKEYDTFSRSWLKECKRILKPTGSLWVIGSYHNIFRVGSVLQDLGFWILNDVIWIKTNPMPNFRGTRFANAHETLIWASRQEKAKALFNYKTMKAFNDDKQMRSDWRLPICSGVERLKTKAGAKAHSTQKPLALLKRILLSSSRPGDVVLDPFFGTGTTGAAAITLNRKFIGIEREKKYIDIARKRLKNMAPCDKELVFLYQEARKAKVPFGCLVESNYIKAGETLYSKDKKLKAKVMADGTLKNSRHSGSIHRLSAKMLNKENHNGWTFWNVKRRNGLISIDKFREQYSLKNKTSI